MAFATQITKETGIMKDVVGKAGHLSIEQVNNHQRSTVIISIHQYMVYPGLHHTYHIWVASTARRQTRHYPCMHVCMWDVERTSLLYVYFNFTISNLQYYTQDESLHLPFTYTMKLSILSSRWIVFELKRVFKLTDLSKGQAILADHWRTYRTPVGAKHWEPTHKQHDWILLECPGLRNVGIPGSGILSAALHLAVDPKRRIAGWAEGADGTPAWY